MGRTHWRRVPRDLRLDGFLALVVAVSTVMAGTFIGGSPPGWFGCLLLTLSAAFLTFRRRFPIRVMALTMLCSLVYYRLGYASGAFTVAPALAVYTATASGRRVAGLLGAGAYLTGVFLVSRFGQESASREGSVWLVVWILVIIVVGEVSRSRTEQLEVARERAHHAEIDREREARRRADEERLRIARELHDVLAHSISVISVQAGVAAHLLDRNPAQARIAVTTIRQATKDVFVELRSILDVLRRVDEESPMTPAPTIRHLDDLVRRTVAGQVRVELDVREPIADLPPDIDLAAYRIVQESLTNVIRHSGAESARVSLRFGDHDLLVRIEDDGRGVSETDVTPGNGLVGMRERAMAVSGRFTAAPGRERGFVVEAHLPLRRHET
ncbi:sensor histidine kinase [Streptosporangium saharense]|uniref:sensor histidine kinase n=1 Tax=Streptosporangium saharense TaxID=1706840 RepID=UPI00341B7D76